MSSRISSSPPSACYLRSPKPHYPPNSLRGQTRQTPHKSAPSSPTGHTHRTRAGYGYPSQPQSARVDKILLDDATPDNNMRDQDDGDPHDLSFPTKHFPRASMVDSLVMSLDQFSPANSTPRSHGPVSKSARYRGHNKSSSITIESELKHPLREIPVVEVLPANDEANGQRVEQLLNADGEEEEIRPENPHNAQRAMQGSKPLQNPTSARSKSRSGSNSSSIDLGHLAAYSGRLGHAGNRRSQSFDFGSVRPKPMGDTNDMKSPATYYSADIGNVPGSTDAAAPALVRRHSGRSVKGNHSRKGRSGTISAASSRPVAESPQPYLSQKSQTFDTTENKITPTMQAEPTSTPRAGFFRRVFGSSNRSVPHVPASNISPAPQLQDHNGSTIDLHHPNTTPVRIPKTASTDPGYNKENQSVITKKPSSFFRRRKKSASGGVPPPLPLTLNSNLDSGKVEAGGSSPVSSLRAFMDPYLVDNIPKHARGSSLQSVQFIGDIHVKDKSLKLSEDNRTERSTNDHRSVPVHMQGLRQRGLSENPPVMKNSFAKDKNNENITHKKVNSGISGEGPGKSAAISPNPVSSTKEYDGGTQNHTSSPNTRIESQPRAVVSGFREESRKEADSPMKPKQAGPPTAQDPSSSVKMIKLVPQSSGSDISEYKSAPSTPMVAETPIKSPIVHVSHPSISKPLAIEELEQARRIYDNIDERVNFSSATSWLGEASSDRERIRIAYMSLFDWTNLTILSAMRNLCSKLVLKGETQQVDRVLDTFSKRWCECNDSHGFKSTDIGRKMTRLEFIRNAMDTIRENLPEVEVTQAETNTLLAVRTNSHTNSGASFGPADRSTSALSTRPTEQLSREESYEDSSINLSGPLVEGPFLGSLSAWEFQVELVLKDFYTSISREPLPLFGLSQAGKVTPYQSTNNLATLSTLRRTPSTLSKSTAEARGRYVAESRSLGARFASKTRARPRLTTTHVFGASRTSIDDQSSAWSPSMSSTWSKVSLNKTLTSMSVESFGPEQASGGYQSSIGFANALSQAIIRDEQMDSHADEGIKAVPLLEDESLELYGAPWAKEGILKHKCHLEGVDKRSKDRNWNDCFAVIEKGWMRLFSFSMTAKSLRNKARNHKAGAVVGGGNWQDNAEEVWNFMLRHTIASGLPPPGYSKQRPYVWALSLPNGAVHLFSVGTPDIVKEFVSTANFWSARLSKEPMTGGISSMEYGWSNSVINRALIGSDSHPGFHTTSPRPSTQMSMRSSIDHGGVRPRLPGDKVHITEWVPPQQSLMASQLLEIDQLKALQVYVKNVEDELQKHNELRGPMLLAFSTRHPNSQRAMANWEKKSSYLLREIVKFRTYIDALQSAHMTKEKVDKMKKEEELSHNNESESTQVPIEVS